MKRISTFFIVAALATIGLTSCNKETYVCYIAEGRVIDKTTGEPVQNIMVSFHVYDIIHSKDEQEKRKPSSIDYEGYDGSSNENGEFNTLIRISEEYHPSLLYIYGNENGLYKDTVISVDFSKVPLSGTPNKKDKYKGDYVLNIGDVALEKIE